MRCSWLLICLTLGVPSAGCREGVARRPLTTAELEAEAGMVLAMTDVALTAQGDGRLAGTGRNTVGELFQIEVVRTGDGLRFHSTHAYPDGRGSVSKEATRPLPPGRS